MQFKYQKRPHHTKKMYSEKDLADKEWREKKDKNWRTTSRHWWTKCAMRKHWWKTLSNRLHRRKIKQLICHKRFDEIPTYFRCEEYFDTWSVH